MGALAAVALLLALARLGSAKRCDVFNVPGKGDMCAPAIFVPAFGKCGTNALKAYTELHPHVKWPLKSEVDFDPDVISPVDLIAQHSPGVWPDDPNVWMVKHPALEHGGAPLAKRLIATYPSAALLFVTCDPATLAFRWYRHYIERTVSYICRDGHACGEHERGDPSGPQDVLRQVRKWGVPNLMELYAKIYTFDQDCVRSEEDELMLSQLHATFMIGMDLFGPRIRCQQWNPADPESAVRTRHDQTVIEFASAGYKMGESMDVFFMEGWQDSGVRYLERIFYILQISLEGYPWDKANDFRPVYSITQSGNTVEAQPLPGREEELSQMRLDNLSLVPVARVAKEAAHRECCSWQALLGTTPPWEACSAGPCMPPPAPTPPLPSTPPLPPPPRPPPPPEQEFLLLLLQRWRAQPSLLLSLAFLLACVSFACCVLGVVAFRQSCAVREVVRFSADEDEEDDDLHSEDGRPRAGKRTARSPRARRSGLDV